MAIPTNEQIRQHIRDMENAISTPCSCKTRREKRGCDAGRKLLRASISVLEWVLGENDRYDELVAELHGKVSNQFLQNWIIRFEREDDCEGR